MKKTAFLICLSLLLGLPALLCAAQTKNFPLQLAKETKLDIYNKTAEGFSAVSRLSEIGLSEYITPEGTFVQLEINGYTKNFDSEGKPHLPVISKLVEVPAGASAKVVIKDYEVETIYLGDISSGAKIGPMQPSVSKNIPSELIEFIYDKNAYATDAFGMHEPATFDIVGTSRGFSFGRLKVLPFRYNPVQNSLQILNNLSFDVLYTNDGASADKDPGQDKGWLAFKRVLASVEKLPDTASARKDALTAGASRPLTFVVVAHQDFKDNTRLNEFIDWKKQLGFNVIAAYTGESPVGSTKESIRRYLEGLYNSSNSPSYVLFIGDIDKIPAWYGKAGAHVTDLYYFTYDGDKDFIPDVYYGRFPADNANELDAIISKTLQYEQFEFVSEAGSDYLDNYMFIAGDDSSYAASHGNAQVNYAVSEYFPTLFKYLYTEARPDISNEIKYNFNLGMGFVNYTGHCDAAGWFNYSMDNYYMASSDLQNMRNRDKYGFVIGNCCESSKFDENDCFGEMILKQSDGGAIGYIGAANDTFWDEDFYWSVGKSSLDISEINVESHTFENTETGIYDGLFYTDNESELYATAGQIVYRGNLAVTETDSREVQYYWEVYNLMGDPSLKPYLSEPDSKNVPEGTSVSGQSEESSAFCFIGAAWDAL